MKLFNKSIAIFLIGLILALPMHGSAKSDASNNTKHSADATSSSSAAAAAAQSQQEADYRINKTRMEAKKAAEEIRDNKIAQEHADKKLKQAMLSKWIAVYRADNQKARTFNDQRIKHNAFKKLLDIYKASQKKVNLMAHLHNSWAQHQKFLENSLEDDSSCTDYLATSAHHSSIALPPKKGS